ncbi:MAG: competence/damage-inducible protein A [Myxococcota bacterium]
MPTAAAVIIGDEILSGKFADENGPFLVARLRALGCDLRRLVTIGDTVGDIADEVARCAAAHDHVVTTGGVGPTHDDRTLEGVAAAFGVPLQERPELVALLDRYGLPRSETNLRMATVPVGAELVLTERSSFPVVRVRNVWVFPGVPGLFRAKFEEVAPAFAGEQVTCVRLRVDGPETDIAAALAAGAGEHPRVAIGSYPRYETDHYVIVTLESRDLAALERAVSALMSALGARRADG